MGKPLFNKVSIVGVGLIGGSLGLAIRKRGLAKFVMGVVRRKETIAEAFRRGALHGATMDLAEGVRGADLVILCAPVSTIVSQLKAIKLQLKKGAIVIDVASSKELVAAVAKKYLKGIRFVGCHPMAGSAKTGIAHASADLFENELCFTTSGDSTVQKFWKALGSSTCVLSAEAHDEWVARMSHLPHILAFTLFQSAGAHKLSRLKIKACNPSIRDLARLSKSDPKLWADIFLSNREEILKALKEHEQGIGSLKKALASKNTRAIEKFILTANKNSHKLSPERRER